MSQVWNNFETFTKKTADVARIFDIALSKVIPVSADKKYNLTTLVDEFVRALPNEKKITMFKAVDKEFQDKTTSKHVKKSFFAEP